ncbi:unnamed protein product [Mytilus edulis]|uniref:Uncharacterized protein n=1 Tax=Mytilus edulis TaxID=6550 RepID=A0A8S3SJ88_MYTED|nr:unnamed protein product [Mytilus edulis]
MFRQNHQTRERKGRQCCMHEKISDLNNFLILKCDYQTNEIGNIATQNHELRNKFKILTDQSADMENQIRISRPSLFGKVRYTKSTSSKVSSEQKNSTKKQLRDNRRLIQYYSNKNSLRELPFSSVRNSAFMNFFDQAAPMKVELKQANIQLRKNKSVVSAKSELLKSAQETIRTLTCKLVKSQNQLDSTEQLKECLDKITKLEKEKEDNAACTKKYQI